MNTKLQTPECNTPFGVIRLFIGLSDDRKMIEAWLGNDVFEYHNEDYPTFDLLQAIRVALHDNSTTDGWGEPFLSLIRSIAFEILATTEDRK